MILRPLSRTVMIGLALSTALGAGGIVLAQSGGGDAGQAAVDSGSFEVGGVEVDVSGKNAELARIGGWRLAQRKAWGQLSQRLTGKASGLNDGTLDSIVTGIVVEQEQIGPTRYIARLGVLFDRNRAGAILGVGAQIRRSSPMLIVPLEVSGGAERVFERETPWQRAWKRFRTGNSSIDYVRPSGTGPDALLMNSGQVWRRGRGWWRAILDQYGADDVLIPEVRLRREWPGGPIIGTFIASHGPDNRRIASFTLRVNDGQAIDALLDEGVKRIDQAYQDALSSGLLHTDRLLAFRPPNPDAEEEAEEGEGDNVMTSDEPATPSATAVSVSVQFDTPSVSSVTAGEASLRGVPGVRSAQTTSIALGGISVMQVSYEGQVSSLRAALESRGWQVQEGAGVLRIRRPGATSPVPTPGPVENSTGE